MLINILYVVMVISFFMMALFTAIDWTLTYTGFTLTWQDICKRISLTLWILSLIAILIYLYTSL